MLCVICGFVMSLSGFAQQINQGQTNQQSNQQLTALRQDLIDAINQISPQELIQMHKLICNNVMNMPSQILNARQLNSTNETPGDRGQKDAEWYSSYVKLGDTDQIKYYIGLIHDTYTWYHKKQSLEMAGQYQYGVNIECKKHQLEFPW